MPCEAREAIYFPPKDKKNQLMSRVTAVCYYIFSKTSDGYRKMYFIFLSPVSVNSDNPRISF